MADFIIGNIISLTESEDESTVNKNQGKDSDSKSAIKNKIKDKTDRKIDSKYKSCKLEKYGCCSDGKTTADSKNDECKEKDYFKKKAKLDKAKRNKPSSRYLSDKNAEVKNSKKCSKSKYGCCADGKTLAQSDDDDCKNESSDSFVWLYILIGIIVLGISVYLVFFHYKLI